MKLFHLFSIGLLSAAACSSPHLPLVATTALEKNMNLSISSQWSCHQRMRGWASDRKGCSYGEPGDYFGEDSLQMLSITPPKRSYCIVDSKVNPSAFERLQPSKPDIKGELKGLKQKDPSAYNEKIAVPLADRMIDVSYESLDRARNSVVYCRSMIYTGPNRKIRVFFRGKDTVGFRETVDAVCKSIHITPAFLNEQIDG